MSQWVTLLLLEPRIYTMFLSQQFYIEGRISSILFTEKCLSGSCLRWIEVGQKILASPLGMRFSDLLFHFVVLKLGSQEHHGSEIRLEQAS